MRYFDKYQQVSNSNKISNSNPESETQLDFINYLSISHGLTTKVVPQKAKTGLLK